MEAADSSLILSRQTSLGKGLSSQGTGEARQENLKLTFALPFQEESTPQLTQVETSVCLLLPLQGTCTCSFWTLKMTSWAPQGLWLLR